jgi:hypothetical protein
MSEIITIQGEPVIEIYESFDGSYWFVTEKLYKQDSVIKGKVYKNDQILFGYVRLSACPQFAEWGNISETELKLLGNWVWKVPQRNWSVCPEVEVKDIPDKPGIKTRLIYINTKKLTERWCSKQKIIQIQQLYIRKMSRRQLTAIQLRERQLK